MSLQIWLPLNGNIENRGLLNLQSPSQNTFIYNDSGKIGKCAVGTCGWKLNEEILGNSWSVATWFNTPNSFISNYNSIIFCKNNTAINDHQIYFSIYGSNVLNLGINGTTYACQYNYSFTTNTWYHVAATYNGSKASLYLNGNLVKTVNFTGAMPSNRLNIRIDGRSTNSENTDTVGNLSMKYNDFRLYDHALTAKEVKEIYKSLVLHLKLDNSGFGQKNMIPDSVYGNSPWGSAALAETIEFDGKLARRISVSGLYANTSSGADTILPGVTFEENTQYTLSVDWRDDYRTDGKQSNLYLRFDYSDGTRSSINAGDLRDKHYWTHRYLTSTAGKTVTKVTVTYGNGGYMYIANLKLEKGTVDTGWAPYEDIDIYDCSGYDQAVTKNNITYDSDSPRYSKSAVFGGSSSYVKFTDNNWMAQYAEAMTINLWAYASDWTAVTNGGRLFSCTETGGFNVEGGATGYWRFPRYVATNADRTSHGYKYNNSGVKLADLSSGWHMFTFVYKPTGEEIYVDGALHSSWNNTSYGLKFNTNARLFLGCEANTANPGGSYFNGKESDFRLYYTALSAADILELYQSTASGDRSGNLYVREAVEA